MDKNKNRTDMLAAGRKKLQQFRQKKDGKGSGSSNHGKSSKNHGKVEKHDKKDDSSLDDRSAESSHLVGNEMGQRHVDSSSGHDDLTVSMSVNDVMPGVDGKKADESAKLPQQEIDVQRHNPEFQSDFPVDEADLANHTVSTTRTASVSEEDTDANNFHLALDHHKISLLGTGGDQVVDGSLSGEVLKYELTEELPRGIDADAVIPVIQSNSHATDSEAEEMGALSKETVMALPSEVESLSTNSLLSLSTQIPIIEVMHSQDVETVNEMLSQAKEDQLAEGVKTHDFAHKSELPHESTGMLDVGVSASNKCVSDFGNPSDSEMSAQEQEASRFIHPLPAAEEVTAVTADIHSPENEAKDKYPQHSFPDLPLIQARENQDAKFPGPEQEQLVSGVDIEANEGRKQDEVLPFAGDADVLEVYTEHIYVANILKDIFSEQLVDQYKPQFEYDDKVSRLEISLEECKERNRTFDGELLRCQSELKATLKNVEELSLAALEWKDKFIRSEKDLSFVSKDLYECRSLVENLQIEKENLNVSLKSMLDERSRHADEKDNMFKENEKLSLEVHDLKIQLSDVHFQNASLIDNIKSATENTRIIDEERGSLVQQNLKLSSELADCQRLLANVQEKYASETITNLTEQNVLRSQHQSVLLDFEKATMEMTECKNSLAYFEAENHKLSADLFSAEEEKMKLYGENQHLLHDYETFLSEHSAIQKVLMSERTEKLNLEADKRMVDNWFEELIEESIFLHISLEVLKSKLRGINDKECGSVKEKQNFLSQRDDSSSVVDPSGIGNSTTPFPQDDITFSILKATDKAIHKGTEDTHTDAAANKGTDGWYAASPDDAVYLESLNFELQVQNEVLKENLRYNLAKYSETTIFNEVLQNRQLALESQNSTYAKTLKDCLSRITGMQNQSLEIKHNLDEIAPSIQNQIRNMEIEVAEGLLWVDTHWNSIVTQIFGSLERLESFSSSSLDSFDLHVTRASMEIATYVGASVNSAISFIKKLQDDYEALKLECLSLDCLYKEMLGNYTNLSKENAASVELLHKVHSSLRSLLMTSQSDETESWFSFDPEQLPDHSQISDFMVVLEQLRNAMHAKRQLKSENLKLCSELDNIIKEMDEISKNNLDMYVITELVELAEKKLKLNTLEADSNLALTSRLENCMSSLLRAHTEADGKYDLIEVDRESSDKKRDEMHVELQQLITLKMEQESEIQSLRSSLGRAEEQLSGLQTELQKKVAEAEQSEQRVSSIREKLSIAVAKGKGLIVQRDNLKQSLADISAELERTRQQLQLSDSRLLEAETKLKTYAEAGERVEALESELSYIRNSATSLRESFLLKDSALQRIEEILEDLELPEHLHSQDIIDKVGWLARSVVGNSNALSSTDWDQKNIPEGASYGDNRIVVMDAWKDGKQGDDLRLKHEELQNKFYGLAEQNEMLEQSLMERNSVVQRLEEALDKINMPAHLHSLEIGSQIEWLGGALSDAVQRASSLQETLDHHETHYEKLLTELEESQKSLSDLKSVLELTTNAKDHLQSTLADLTGNLEEVQERAASLERENSKMQTENNHLLVKLDKNSDYIDDMENGIRRMLDLICTALRDPSQIETASVGCNIMQLEEMLRKLIDDHTRLSAVVDISQESDDGSIEKAVSAKAGSERIASLDHDASNLNTLKKELEEALGNLTHVEEERDQYMEMHKSLNDEMEVVQKQDEELRNLLNLEEQKSASLREKLNVAVRKGKSLVQQRDSLKQTIEDLNIKVDSFTFEINNFQSTITQYEEKCRELTYCAEKVRVSESENQMLRNRLTESEQFLQEKGHALSLVMDILNGIRLNGGFSSSDPVDKLKQLGKSYHDLVEAKALSEQEAVKSKRAAELLLAELNEVQERNDALHDELAKVIDERAELSKAYKIVEAARVDALSQLAECSASQKDEHKKLHIQLVELKSSVDQFSKIFEDVIYLLADVFSMDMDFFTSLELCLDASDGTLHDEHDDKQKMFFQNRIPAWENFIARDSWLKYKTQGQVSDSAVDDVCQYVEHRVSNCISNISFVKVKLENYISLKTQEAARVSTNLRSARGDIVSRIKSLEKENEIEKSALLTNISLLYQACADSIHEIGNKKARISTNNQSSIDMRMNTISADSGDDLFLSEEHIRTLSERLIAAVKDLSIAEQESFLADHLEMKNTISNLQKEIHEKDIQKERICMELVGQIKRAEAAANNYSHDLEVAEGQINELKTRVSAIEKDKNLLERKMEEEKTASVELQEKNRSMVDFLSAKDQEIESLMQALDEEESELEEMRKKVEQMEAILQQKDKEMGKLEHSHNKAMKKLSVTVSKFDELHDLSASLLTEVEKLQMHVQEKDKEVSFLREEVTRCTNDMLLASKSKKNSDEIIELFEWLKTVTPQVDLVAATPKNLKPNDAHVYKDSIQNQIASVILELEDIRHFAESRNEMLQDEKSKVQELMKKQESLETALRQKEAQLNLLEEAPASSGTGGIEQLENKWVVPGPSTSSQVRSLRKSNIDQVAIAIEDDPASSSRLEDEDEDKVHGFKSLTTSRIVPRFTRPVSDMIDGLWVSCDRALMRQPALRLTIIMYWALLHALLAAFVV